MTPSPVGRVLIIDDEQDIVAMYREILAEEGFESDAVRTHAEAVAALAQPNWAVVLLDQRLRGRDDPDSGLDLLHVIRQRAPYAKVIVVTGYADAVAVRRAFADGAWDYLQKGGPIDALLRVKVRNAMEPWRERALAALSREKREAEIRALWTAARTEKDANKKGAHLETLMLLLFRSIEGFAYADVNRQNELEEIDVIVQNASTDPFWQKEGNYLLVECKNWSKPVGSDELNLFQLKVDRRFGRSTLGFFVALQGYAKTVRMEEWTRRGGQSLVVLLDGDDLEALIDASDRNAKLKEFHLRAVVAQGK